MERAFVTLALMLCCVFQSDAQFIRFSPTGDTTQSITLEGYADVYYGFDFNHPNDGNRPYFVSHSRNNEINLNLAYLSIKYNSERARATFTPGFGTYMNANYALEGHTLGNIIEANIGVKPFKNSGIWIDAGVFATPYTPENAVAHDQLLYTRSLAAESSPYYLTGIRATVPLGNKVKVYLYLVNGWQVIEDINASLSFGSAIEWKPTDKLLVNWSTYVGNEGAASQPQYKGRFFTDLYAVYSPNKKLTISADIYAGRQELSDSTNKADPLSWYQGNVNAKYMIAKRQSVAARVEYFRDGNTAIIIPVTGVERFDCGSVSLGYNIAVTNNVAFHIEGRYFSSDNDIFLDEDAVPVNTSGLLIGGLTAKF